MRNLRTILLSSCCFRLEGIRISYISVYYVSSLSCFCLWCHYLLTSLMAIYSTGCILPLDVHDWKSLPPQYPSYSGCYTGLMGFSWYWFCMTSSYHPTDSIDNEDITRLAVSRMDMKAFTEWPQTSYGAQAVLVIQYFKGLALIKWEKKNKKGKCGDHQKWNYVFVNIVHCT